MNLLKSIGILGGVFILIPLVALGSDGAGNRLTKAAITASKPIVVDFGKGQCVQCIKQSETIEEVRGQCGEEVEFDFVHVIKEAWLSDEYKVFLIPTLVFLDSSGEEVYRHVGLLRAEELRDTLEELDWADF